MKSLIALIALCGIARADDVPALRLDLEMFADADWIARDGADVTQFRLDRGEAGATVGLASYAGAELRLESIRSAIAGGSAGIDGDSLVMRVKRAQIFARDLELGDFTIGGAIGVVPDPWIAALETDYPLRPLSATASEGLLGWSTGDLAAQARVAYGPARLTVNVGNGEGLRYPERNDGKTTTGVLELKLDRVRLLAMGRDGSIGPARVRDQRVGGGATFAMPIASAGVELVRAYGVGDLGDVTAWAFAGWAEVRPIDRLAFSLRGSTVRFDGGHRTSAGGAIAFDARPPRHATLRLWLALDRTTGSGTADPVPGLDPGSATTLLLIASTTAPYVIP